MHCVISHFPKKYSCCTNRFQNGALLLFLIIEQAEPAVLSKNSLLDNLNSQSKERCSTEAHSSGAEHTLPYDFLMALWPSVS